MRFFQQVRQRDLPPFFGQPKLAGQGKPNYRLSEFFPPCQIVTLGLFIGLFDKSMVLRAQLLVFRYLRTAVIIQAVPWRQPHGRLVLGQHIAPADGLKI